MTIRLKNKNIFITFGFDFIRLLMYDIDLLYCSNKGDKPNKRPRGSNHAGNNRTGAGSKRKKSVPYEKR